MMGIKTVPQPSYRREIDPCDFWLFPKLRGGRYETIEEIKESVTKVIDTLTQDDFHVAFQKLLERYNKCITAGGDYFERDMSFMCVLSIKEPIRKKSENLFNDPRSNENGSPCRRNPTTGPGKKTPPYHSSETTSIVDVCFPRLIIINHFKCKHFSLIFNISYKVFIFTRQ